MSLLSNRDQKVPPFMNFIIGGMSGAIGQSVTHPLDVTKIRMQLSKTSFGETVREIYQENGLRGFYVGWTAGFLRQLIYSTTRLGIYITLYDMSQQHFGPLNYPTMIGIGMMSGLVGSFLGTPTDLVLVRMIADMKLPPEKRWNYRNGFLGLVSIVKKDGLLALWRGALPTMIRGAVVNGTQLGTYSKAKIMLKDTGYFEEGVPLQFFSAMLSGVLTTSTSLPMDVAKTRIQNWNLPTKPPGLFGMMYEIMQKDGLASLWRGFMPYYSRSAPNTVLTMIFVDQFHHIYKKLFVPANE